MLNWTVWNRTVLLTELFEIKLVLCIKVDFIINDLQWLIRHQPKLNATKIISEDSYKYLGNSHFSFLLMSSVCTSFSRHQNNRFETRTMFFFNWLERNDYQSIHYISKSNVIIDALLGFKGFYLINGIVGTRKKKRFVLSFLLFPSPFLYFPLLSFFQIYILSFP